MLRGPEWQQFLHSAPTEEARLWRAVIVRAITDVVTQTRPVKGPGHRSESRPTVMEKLDVVLFLYSNTGKWAAWRHWVEVAAGLPEGYTEGLIRLIDQHWLSASEGGDAEKNCQTDGDET